jgi:hypothetical protein
MYYISNLSETIYACESMIYEVYRKGTSLGKKRNVGLCNPILAAYSFKFVSLISRPALGSNLSPIYWALLPTSGLERKRSKQQADKVLDQSSCGFIPLLNLRP